jgi:hypothetical protein
VRRKGIGAAAAAALIVGAAGHAGAQERQSGQDQVPGAQEMQKGRDPPPGAENLNKRAERAQSAAPMSEGQGQKPADAQEVRQVRRGLSCIATPISTAGSSFLTLLSSRK